MAAVSKVVAHLPGTASAAATSGKIMPSAFTPGRVGTFTVSSVPRRHTLPLLRVRADSEDERKELPRAAKGLGKALKDSVESTKQEVNAETIKQNMENNESEKKSVIGVEPARGSTIPRPEIERRPETGDRSFGSLMAFDGAGPETINGRLAMVGFVWAVLVEMRTHVPAIVQLFDPSGTPDGWGRLWFITTVLIIFGASLIPMFNGESTDSRKAGAFTAKAERWNGRLAMIGFAGLLLTEVAIGRAVF